MDSSCYNRIEFLGNSCGQHGSYTFYRGIRYWKDGKCHSLSLGEFFLGQMSSCDHVIPLIGELQLLWEEKHHEGLKLSSVRLYILPEDCPTGRLPNHGQDEILAEDDKIVLKVEDLMKLVVLEPVFWPKGLLATHKMSPQIDFSCLNGFRANRATPCPSGNRECCEGGSVDDSVGTRVVILSYARYCRYRAALKRFEGCSNRWLSDFLVAAIGGFSTGAAETRVMFCRSTVEHPVVEKYEHRMNHLAPSLKGRRRKKRPKSKTNESEDSNESETNSEKNALQCASTEESVLEKRQPTEELSELSRPKPKVKKNLLLTEKGFLKRLHKYMNDQGTPIVRIPTLGFKEVNLFQFYQCTQNLGGYDTVTERRLWKLVYDQLGGSPGNTSAATGTRKNYEKLLLEFERHVHSRKKPVSIEGEMKPVSLDENVPLPTPPNIQNDPRDREMSAELADDDVSATRNPVALKLQESENSKERTSELDLRALETRKLSKHSDAFQMKSTIKPSNGQKKLLRKTSLLTCNSIKKNLSGDLVEKSFLDKRETIRNFSPTEDLHHLTTSVISKVKPKLSAVHSSINHRHADLSLINSKVTSIIPCTVSLEIINDKFCEKPEVPVEGNFGEAVRQVKREKLDSSVNESESVTDADKHIEDYLCSVGKTTSPLLELKSSESRHDTSSVRRSLKSQKLRSASEPKSTKGLMNTVEASSISQKLLSGGCAVIETGLLDHDQSNHFLSSELDACLPSVSPFNKKLGNEPSKSIPVVHGFKDEIVSPYALGIGSSLTSPLTSSCSPLTLDDASSLNLGQMKANHLSTLSIPFTFDVGLSSDDRLSKCRSSDVAVHSLETNSSPSLKKQLLTSVPKRTHPFDDPHLESRAVDAKKYKGDLENHVGSSLVERSFQLHRSSVISSPIKRFIDGTKCWIPPADPNQTTDNNTHDLSWTPADDQPTDLSMKTMLSRKGETELPQDQPLDLSKSSSLYRTEKNKDNMKPVALPGYDGTGAGPAILKNGHMLSTPMNKVALVTPSLRSTPNFMPVTSYQMSGLDAPTTLTSLLPQNLHTMRPEQLAPLVAYAPSFHPAFQILSAPILSAIASPGSLLSSGSTTSPQLAVPFLPVLPLAQNSSTSSSSTDGVPEIGNSITPSVLKLKSSNRK